MAEYYEHRIRRTIKAFIFGMTEDQIDNLAKGMQEYFQAGEAEVEYELDYEEYPRCIIYTEEGTEKVWQGCPTLSNGDPGYPDEYEDDLDVTVYIVEDYIQNYIDSNGLIDIDYKIEQNDESL